VISRHLPVSNLSAEIKPHDNTDCIASNLVTSENPSKSCKIKHDIVVAVIGSIGNNKGFKLLAEVVNYARQENFPLHFTVIGTTMNNSQILSYGNVSITGKYQERDFQRLVESARPDCALFLSPWPETYSYTLSLAFANGIFPFVLDIGAQSERVRQAGFGVVLNSDSPSFIVRKIMNTFLDHSRA